MPNGDAVRWSAHMTNIARIGAMSFALMAILALHHSARAADRGLGPFGPEGGRMREQLWILPSADPNMQLRATVFRPSDNAADAPERRPLVVINHGTDEQTRLSVSMPVYYWLSRWFVDRGYVVVIPQRRGHGATGGDLIESVGTCETADHYASGQIAANDISASINYMTEQPFVVRHDVVVVGISTGGWASLALASRNLPQVGAIVNFAGGRGGHAYGRANAICNADSLLKASHAFAETARVPSLWLYAENDSYFNAKLAQAMTREWTSGGGKAETHILPSYQDEGHRIADDRAGWDLWGDLLDGFLDRNRGKPDVETAGRDEKRDAGLEQVQTAVSDKAPDVHPDHPGLQ